MKLLTHHVCGLPLELCQCPDQQEYIKNIGFVQEPKLEVDETLRDVTMAKNELEIAVEQRFNFEEMTLNQKKINKVISGVLDSLYDENRVVRILGEPTLLPPRIIIHKPSWIKRLLKWMGL